LVVPRIPCTGDFLTELRNNFQGIIKEFGGEWQSALALAWAQAKMSALEPRTLNFFDVPSEPAALKHVIPEPVALNIPGVDSKKIRIQLKVGNLTPQQLAHGNRFRRRPVPVPPIRPYLKLKSLYRYVRADDFWPDPLGLYDSSNNNQEVQAAA
jgi:hypothetical protein